MKKQWIWRSLYFIDEACDAWTGFVEDVLNDIEESIKDLIEKVIDFVKGCIFAVVALPIGVIGAMAHRLKKFCEQEQALDKYWANFTKWYREQQKGESK